MAYILPPTMNLKTHLAHLKRIAPSGGKATWANTTPEQRSEKMKKVRGGKKHETIS